MINLRTADIILHTVFLWICIFFPGDPYHIKIALLMSLLCINAKEILTNIGKNPYRPVLLFGFLFPLAVVVNSIVVTGDAKAAITGAYSPIILLLLVPTLRLKIDYKQLVLNPLKVMAILTISIASADIIGIFDVNGTNIVRNAFYEYGIGLMGKSPAYSSYYRIFFKASPLLLLLLDDSISKEDCFWLIMTFVAIWFSGTRANVFSALIVIIGRCAIMPDKRTARNMIISMLFLMILLAFAPKVWNLFAALMTTEGSVASDSLRAKLVRSYVEEFSNPEKLLFGSGFGSAFYSFGREAIETNSELSYFELIRRIGLILTTTFFLFIMFPLMSRKVTSGSKVAYGCYLISAATNPLLFSSTAMIMYSFYYFIIIKSELPDEHLYEIHRLDSGDIINNR